MRGGGRRNYFDNPFEQRGDLSHASIFVVAIFVFIGVAGVLYYGNRVTIPADPAAAISMSLPEPVQRFVPTNNGAPKPTVAAASNSSAGAAGVAAPAQPVTPRQAIVAGNGTGAAIYRTPNLNDQLLTWPDGTGIELQGEEQEAQGGRWLKVKDPRGNVGWMLSQQLQVSGQ